MHNSLKELAADLRRLCVNARWFWEEKLKNLWPAKLCSEITAGTVGGAIGTEQPDACGDGNRTLTVPWWSHIVRHVYHRNASF